MIVAQVEVGHFSIPTCDVDVAFEPTEPIGVGGVELPCAVFTMAAGNDKPWVYLLARNNSRVTRYLKAGERVGTTTTEFSATAMTGRMQHGDRNCGITCADALNSDCLCKTVDDRPPGIFTTYVGEGESAEFCCSGDPARFLAVNHANIGASPISLGGRDDDVRISDAFVNDTATDEMCVGNDDLEEHLGKVAMHWLEDSRAKPGKLVGGGEAENNDDRMVLEDVDEALMRSDFDAMVEDVAHRLRSDESVGESQVATAISMLRTNMDSFIKGNRARMDDSEYPFYIRIPTRPGVTIAVPPYRYPADKLAALHDWADKTLDKGHIEHTTSAWNAPMVLTRKKDGGGLPSTCEV
jgi:hypothetical protein